MAERIHTLETLREVAARLRERQAGLAPAGLGQLQQRAVRALSQLAASLLAQEYGGFAQSGNTAALETAWFSLSATLESWREELLWALIDSEDVRAPADAPKLALHIIATNTPLLAWTSAARALLVGSASIVRVPPAAEDVLLWSERFVNGLREIDKQLAGMVELVSWPSDDENSTRLAAQLADTVLVYGGDATIRRVRELTPPNARFVGFGSRISFGIVLAGSDWRKAARGAALDIAVLDQQGCLSPQFIFVQGSFAEIVQFGQFVAKELQLIQLWLPQRDASGAARIGEALALAQFNPGVHVIRDPELRWSVIADPEPHFGRFAIPGLVTILPWNGYEELERMLGDAGLLGKLQGVSVAAPDERSFQSEKYKLQRIGVSYVCRPGELQRPPFSWREDGKDVLRSLL